MHICFLSHEYPEAGKAHGGIGSFLKLHSRQLINAGHHVTVIGFGRKSVQVEENDNGVRIIRTALHKIKGISWILNAARINAAIRSTHAQHPIDLIEGQEGAFALIRKIKGIPFIIRLHGGHHFFAEGEKRGINPWKGFLEKRSFNKADGFIAVSNFVKEHTSKYLSYNSKPVTIINYPISIDQFYPADPNKVVPYRLVFAGTVCEKKGVRQLIGALPLIEKEFPSVQLEIYGRDWYFPDKRSYIAWLKELFPSSVLEKVTFKGAVNHSDLPQMYEAADVCVFPSHVETQGLVAPEAMAMEKVVVFSNTGPGPETIQHGVNGWLCDPHSEQSIAQTVIEALKNRSHKSELGKKARELVLKKFNPDSIIEQNISFYKSLLI